MINYTFRPGFYNAQCAVAPQIRSHYLLGLLRNRRKNRFDSVENIVKMLNDLLV